MQLNKITKITRVYTVWEYKRQGFTLIELLVVVAIIGLLASVAFVALNSARIKSRDAKRVADIKEMATALELYFDTCHSYPVIASNAAIEIDSSIGLFQGTEISPSVCGDNTGGGNNGGFRASELGTSFAVRFSDAPLPADRAGVCDTTTGTGAPSNYTSITWPAGTNWNSYVYFGDSSTYQITFCLGNKTDLYSAGKHVLRHNGVR